MPRTAKGHNYVNFHKIPSKSIKVINTSFPIIMQNFKNLA